MIVHHEDVEGEARLLGQGAADRVGDGLFPVPHGDHDAGLHGIRRGVPGRQPPEGRRQPGPETVEMRRRRRFHLPLIGEVPGVHIGEMRLAALFAEGGNGGRPAPAEPFRNMDNGRDLRHLQAQVV